jgi:hypothetical protein
LKFSIAFLPTQAAFDADAVISFLLLSGYDKTASGAAQTDFTGHYSTITQTTALFQACSDRHTILYLLVGVHGSSTVSPEIT